ncbi:hypothetical protein CASFOL_024140 [Castilleja foliolosa]|uniref:RAI1-like domain-containing protein n=1 Tax=Castilleja foliolosa TaxID=1961234 RepID=A0ABD3CP84_9LAMI
MTTYIYSNLKVNWMKIPKAGKNRLAFDKNAVKVAIPDIRLLGYEEHEVEGDGNCHHVKYSSVIKTIYSDLKIGSPKAGKNKLAFDKNAVKVAIPDIRLLRYEEHGVEGDGNCHHVKYSSVIKTQLEAHRILMGAEMDCCDSTDEGRRFYVELKTSLEIITLKKHMKGRSCSSSGSLMVKSDFGHMASQAGFIKSNEKSNEYIVPKH